MILRNKSSGLQLVAQLEVAIYLMERMKGLLGKRNFSQKALLIRPCNQIHTWFMKFPIDVLFINEQHQVIEKLQCLKPWNTSEKVQEAVAVIEAEAGVFSDEKVKIGDILEMVKVNDNE